MHCVKLNLICNRIAIGLINRKFQTCSALSVRKHKMIYREEPGLQNLKSTFECDEEFMKDLSEENDDLLLDHQYLKNDIDNDKRKERLSRELLGRKIAKKKYFKTKPQPAMLTWAEKEYIKYLNKTDPVQWNIDSLSESFPATPVMIKNILKMKLKLSPNKIEKKDKKVQENWELLSEDKLEGDPEFIEHCKQFVNCRNVILDNARKLNFYLPEIKEKKTFNCGEMSSILEDYEKMLDKMIKNDQNLLTDGKTGANSKDENQKGSLELLHEEIEEERKIRDLEGKESFYLNKYSKNFKQQVTFQELQRGIVKKAERGRTLNISEKAILERELNKNSYVNTSTLGYNKSEILGIAGKEFGRRKGNMKKRITGKPGIYESEEDLNIHAFDEPLPKDFRNRQAFDEPLPEKALKNKHAFDDFVSEGTGNTKVLDATNVGKFVHFKDSNVFYNEYNENTVEKTKVKKKKKNLKASIQNDITVEERSNVDCSDGVLEDVLASNVLNKEKSVFLGSTDSIEQNSNEDKEANFSSPTSNNQEKNEDRIVFQLEDKDSIKYPQPKERAEVSKRVDIEVSKKVNSIGQTRVMFENYYPEKIVIPEDKKKLGSLFKVKDCYYDNKGEFLYRVPGITK